MTPATVDTDENLIILGDEVTTPTFGEICFPDAPTSDASEMIIDFGTPDVAPSLPSTSQVDEFDFFLQDTPTTSEVVPTQAPTSSEDFLLDFCVSDIAPTEPVQAISSSDSLAEISFGDTEVIDQSPNTPVQVDNHVVSSTPVTPSQNLGDRLTILDRFVTELEGRKSEIESLKVSKTQQIDLVNAQMEALKATLQDYEAELADYTKEENVIIKDISSIQKMKSEDSANERARGPIKK